MHSHHTHSGSYIAHASDDLEAIVERASNMGFTHFCLTEHMPRLEDRLLYPEEEERDYTSIDLHENFNKYLAHAIDIQKRLLIQKKMNILIGMEIEGLDDNHIAYAKHLLKEKKELCMSVGSVHHVHGIPIDFSPELWIKAVSKCAAKTARGLFNDYFDLQYKVLFHIKPDVVGHFDLIRLFCPQDDIDVTTKKTLGEINLRDDWPEVWEKILRNVRFAVDYGGLFELNSAAIRKGWDTPYPKKDVCDLIIENSGRFCFSDDCHSVSQVGLNYQKILNYVKDTLRLKEIYYLESKDGTTVSSKSIDIGSLEKSSFWKQYS